MSEIEMIPNKGEIYDKEEPDFYWHQTVSCSGFDIKPDCPWRYDEMSLVTFTPQSCLN